jgi:hypothetical protein
MTQRFNSASVNLFTSAFPFSFHNLFKAIKRAITGWRPGYNFPAVVRVVENVLVLLLILFIAVALNRAANTVRDIVQLVNLIVLHAQPSDLAFSQRRASNFVRRSQGIVVSGIDLAV